MEPCPHKYGVKFHRQSAKYMKTMTTVLFILTHSYCTMTTVFILTHSYYYDNTCGVQYMKTMTTVLFILTHSYCCKHTRVACSSVQSPIDPESVCAIWNLIFQCVARSWNPPLRVQSKCPVAPVGDSVQHKKKY